MSPYCQREPETTPRMSGVLDNNTLIKAMLQSPELGGENLLQVQGNKAGPLPRLSLMDDDEVQNNATRA